MKVEFCFICKTDIDITSHCAFSKHLKTIHHITKSTYLEQFVYTQPNYLTCGCGCNGIVAKLHVFPYKRMYVSGHNARAHNPMKDRVHTDVAKSRMRQKRTEYVLHHKQHNLPLPYHSANAIQRRAHKQTEKWKSHIEAKCNITILSTLRKSGIGYYTIRCNVCDHTFDKFHDDVYICPRCAPPQLNSKLENDIYEFIYSLIPSIAIQRNDRSVLNGKELDIYIPDYSLAIEIDGLFYHSELSGNKHKSYHIDKTLACEQRNIRLIHIFEDEWIHTPDIVKSKLRQILNRTTISIGARKCSIVIPSRKEATAFLTTHHLQGAGRFKYAIGLSYQGQLISVMTFATPDASRGHTKQFTNTYELMRFANKINTSVPGSASRLLRHFISTYAPSEIISYADRRWSTVDNNVYETVGFIQSKINPPSYWYIKTGVLKRHHRFKFTKKRTVLLGGLSTNTEWENMKNMGFDRIWDCGTIKYTLNI